MVMLARHVRVKDMPPVPAGILQNDELVVSLGVDTYFVQMDVEFSG